MGWGKVGFPGRGIKLRMLDRWEDHICSVPMRGGRGRPDMGRGGAGLDDRKARGTRPL